MFRSLRVRASQCGKVFRTWNPLATSKQDHCSTTRQGLGRTGAYFDFLGFRHSDSFPLASSFHAETRILTTIFDLLFWDIIFADIPGAFETKYQIAPLDLVEDSFYYAREEMIERRLTELADGKACDILARHENLYRENKTWCVGVRWDVCGAQELAEIVEVRTSSLAEIDL